MGTKFVRSLALLLLVAFAVQGQQQFAAPGSEIDVKDGAVHLPPGEAGGQAAVNSSSQQAEATPAAPAQSTSPATHDASTAGNTTHSPEQLGSKLDSPCFKDPSQSSCKEYRCSDDQAKADLSAICGSKPFLSACSLFKLCNQGVHPASIGKSPRTCNTFHLLATACKHDSIGRDSPGCAKYKALCANNTAVSQCKDYAGLKYVTPTAAALQLTELLCETTADEACKRCDLSADTPNCDIFSVYGEVCHLHRELNECGPWGKMCEEDPALYVCRAQLAGGRPGPSESRTGGWGPGSGQQQWVASSAASSSIHLGLLASLGAAALAVAAAV